MKNCIVIISLLLAQTAYAAPKDDCGKLLDDPSASSYSRFQKLQKNVELNNSDNLYDPEFKLRAPGAEAAVKSEREIISHFANHVDHVRAAFYYTADVTNGWAPMWREYARINGEVFQKSQFKGINQALGRSGLWLIFRSYSWRHLGYADMAGPHMSIIIGDRDYEIGRPLKRVGNQLKLTTFGPAGPLAMSIDDFLLKTSLESKDLGANPGVFFAIRLAGVNESALNALTSYYEHEAKLFKSGKRFKYVMDPSLDPDGRNCTTYLTEPMINKALTGGIDLKSALGLHAYTASPVNMLYENAGFSSPHLAKKIMFVDNEDWRRNLGQEVLGTKENNAVVDASFRADAKNLSVHPQLKPFFTRQIKFFELPR